LDRSDHPSGSSPRALERICEIDPDMDEVSGDIANSIARDFVRLSAAGLV
jgi:hypothetical protein